MKIPYVKQTLFIQLKNRISRTPALKTSGLFLCLLMLATTAFAQKPVIGVLNIETSGLTLTPESAGNLMRLELEKKDRFSVIDKHDMSQFFRQDTTKTLSNCLGKTCLVETGKAMGAVKMLSGSIEKFGDKIIIAARLIDVNAAVIEKTQIDEYLNVPENIQDMVRITLDRLLGIDYNQDLFRKLTQKYDYDSEINNPGIEKLTLNGPRTGYVFLTGKSAERFQAPRGEGGFDGLPGMFVFGYQFETQYLNSGNFQALFEFIPAISGMDQGLFIPGFTFLNGFRSNKEGWEIGFGPNFTVSTMAEGGYYDIGDGKRWYDMHEIKKYGIEYNINEIMRLPDRRGEITLTSSFVFAVGKSFRSGRVNIPVNAYFIPGKYGTRFGVMMGFNAKKTKR